MQIELMATGAGSGTLRNRRGFRELGTRERIALFGSGPFAGGWRDTITLERRSTTVGR